MMKLKLSIALGLAVALGGCASVATAPGGTVTLNCAVGDDQRLTDCRVVKEHPEGMGYGAMALATADKPEVRLSGAAATGARVQYTMRIQN